MLYKPDPYTVENFIAFCRSKGDEAFNYSNPHKCAHAQFCKSIGVVYSHPRAQHDNLHQIKGPTAKVIETIALHKAGKYGEINRTFSDIVNSYEAKWKDKICYQYCSV